MHPYSKLPAQFVNWKELPQAGKKPRKVPWSNSKNHQIDHLNPENWQTYDTVAACDDLHPAFVLPRHDDEPPEFSLFLLDLDDCRHASTGDVQPWAQSVMAMFPGAFVEISHSRTGFHIMGYCRPAAMGRNRKHKFTYADSPHNGAEWYMDGRFIALGEYIEGDLNLDWTDVLTTLVPEKDKLPASSTVSSVGVASDYTGPQDDDALLALIARDTNYDALQPRRIPASAFYGNMETLRSMCHGAYGQDTGKPAPFDYDASSVDMTLANHLAYFTGGDVPRMDRLFRQSLMGQRDKVQNRPQYLFDTLTQAARMAIQGGRYLKGVVTDNLPEMLRRISGPTDAILSQVADALARLDAGTRERVMTEAQEICPKGVGKALKEAVQARHDAFRVEQGAQAFDMLKQGELDNWFIVNNENGTAMAIDRRGGTSGQTKTAFVESRAHLPKIPMMDANGTVRMLSAAETWWIDPTTERYEYQSFHPGRSDTYTDNYGRSVRNTFRPAHDSPATAGGDIEPYLHILRANIPTEADQIVLLSALAFAVQKPGEMLLWAPVMQGAQGSGKGTLIKRPLVYALGRNLGIAGPKQLASEYNGYMYRKTAVVVDEIGEHSKATIAEIADSLKEPVAESPVPYRIMRRDPFDDDNFTCWFFLTNHMNSMLANDLNERRYAHLVSALQTPEQVTRAFPDNWWADRYPHVVAIAGGNGMDWFRYYQVWWDSQGAEAVRGMLEQYPAALPGRAPVTTTRHLAEAASEPEAVTQIREAIEARLPGFRSGFVSSIAIRELLKSEGMRMPYGRWLNDAMQRLGYVYNIRTRVSAAESMRFPMMDSTQMRLYYSDASLIGKSASNVLDAYDQGQTDVSGGRTATDKIVPMKKPLGT